MPARHAHAPDMYPLNDTIAAVSSTPGPAARGIIRLSGPQAARFAAAVFIPDENHDQASSPLQALARLHWRWLGGSCRLARHITCRADAFGFLPPILAAAAQSLPDLGILANSSRLLRHR